jgi:hypothetical protein
MKIIHKYLAQKQAKFAQHPFFERIAEDRSLDELVPFAQRMTFWIQSFQDLLRLNEARVINPELRKIARCHRVEDEGHNEWFISDLSTMNSREPGIRSLYSSEHSPIRDASYLLISEVFRARNDYERIVLLLILESAAYIFFERIADFSERAGYSGVLKYFSNHHFSAEQSHQSLDEQSIEAYIDSIQLTQDEKKGIFEMIDRAYNAFTVMFDNFETTFERRVKVLV